MLPVELAVGPRSASSALSVIVTFCAGGAGKDSVSCATAIPATLVRRITFR